MAYALDYSKKDYSNPLYVVWRNMKRRCYDPKDKQYKDWGGRGIQVCQRWLDDFSNFYRDLGKDFKPGLQIDRVDNNGNYTPNNCRWATAKEQSLNRRSNRWIEFRGELRTIYQWAEHLNINRTTLSQRIDAYGWSIEKAFTSPVRKGKV